MALRIKIKGSDVCAGRIFYARWNSYRDAFYTDSLIANDDNMLFDIETAFILNPTKEDIIQVFRAYYYKKYGYTALHRGISRIMGNLEKCLVSDLYYLYFQKFGTGVLVDDNEPGNAS